MFKKRKNLKTRIKHVKSKQSLKNQQTPVWSYEFFRFPTVIRSVTQKSLETKPMSKTNRQTTTEWQLFWDNLDRKMDSSKNLKRTKLNKWSEVETQEQKLHTETTEVIWDVWMIFIAFYWLQCRLSFFGGQSNCNKENCLHKYKEKGEEAPGRAIDWSSERKSSRFANQAKMESRSKTKVAHRHNSVRLTIRPPFKQTNIQTQCEPSWEIKASRWGRKQFP